MRSAAITFACCLAAPALADARSITLGAGLGLTQSKAAAENEPDDTLQLFGRVGLTSRLSAQLELQRIEDPYLDIRTGTALLVVELADSSRLAPLLLAGVGIDRASATWYEGEGTHIEGGFGLEYRAEGGLTIGGDVRLGGRSVENTSEVYPLADGAIGLWLPSQLESGEYRSARLYAAIRF